MENKDADYWFDKGYEFYNSGNIEEAIKCFAEVTRLNPDDDSAFYNWGNAIYDLAKIKQDESLFRESFEKYAEATRLNPKNDSAFYNWGIAIYDLAKIKQDESLFRESFEKYAEATRLNPDYADAFINWGLAISNLAKIKQDESLFRESFEKYAEATRLNPNYALAFSNWGVAIYDLAEIKQDESLFLESFEKYAEATRLNPNYADAFNNWGIAICDYLLYKIKLNESLSLKVVKYFEKLEKDILSIFVYLDKEYSEQILQTKILYPLLDSNTDDGHFFKETTKNITPKEGLDKYKKAYILSIYIISQLHVKDKNEKLVAHYREKTVSQKMLFKDKNSNKVSKFRLNAINYSNDPTEGKTLCDFLFGEKCPTKEALSVGYGAFAGCFIFNHDSLNQYRLYGKEDGKEGTGLSLVFRDSFFSKEAKMALKQTKMEDNNFSKEEQEKHALFRCIYIDPVTQRVETVGQKEAYLFYREKNQEDIEKEIKKYNKYIADVIKNIRKKMNELRNLVKDLNPAVVGQLLINLRYLTKHIAFKEEQECRIVRIHRLDDKNIQTSEDFKQMYVEYLNIPNHIEKIYFGAKATGMELFQDVLKHEGLNIYCEKSTNPLA